MEEREGTISSVSNLTLKDSINGEDNDFVNPASVIITDGSIAVYVVNTPKRIIRVIREIKL